MMSMSWPWIDYESSCLPSNLPDLDSGSPSSSTSTSPVDSVEGLSRQFSDTLILFDQNKEFQDHLPPSNPRFKTEICRNFKEKGSCVYGGLCQFAHGKHELRQDVIRHTKYKTKLCQKYWIAGYCAYGPRCNFIHKEMEKRGDDTSSVLPEHCSKPPPGVIRRAGTGFTRPSQNSHSTMVRNVSDVLRIAKLRSGSQGDSGNESGSDNGMAPSLPWLSGSQTIPVPGRDGVRPILGISRNCEDDFFKRPIGSERQGMKGWPQI